MSRISTPSTSAQRQGGLFILLFLTIFCTEVVLEGVSAPLFARLTPISSYVLDALFLTLLYVAPFWLFFVRPLCPPGAEGGTAAAGRVRLLLGALAVLFFAELLVMLLLQLALPMLPLRLHNGIDALCTATASTPVLWWLFSRHTCRERVGGELLDTPVRLYVVLLLMAFLLTMTQELLSDLLVTSLPTQWSQLVEAIIVTLLFAPVLYYLVVRPLMRSALSEQARLSALHVQMTDAVVTLDAAGVITSANPAAEEIFGYDATELVGAGAELLFHGGRECLQALLDGAAPARRGERFDFTATRRDGIPLTMDVSLSRITMGRGDEFMLVMRDVSERRRMQRELEESEERFRQIFDESDDAIVFFDPESCAVVDVNGTTERLFGCGKGELAARGVQALVNAEDVPALQGMIRSCLSGNARLECVRRCSECGAELFLSIRGKMMTLQGVPLAYCTFRNITARIRLEEEAREMQSRLIHMNKMASLGLVVSGVAHEVNNPNAYILANSELLAGAWQDALKILHEYREAHGEFLLGGLPFDQIAGHVPELYEGVVDGARRISEIVNNLKQFARDDRGGGRQVDVNRTVQAAVSILQYELHKHTEHFHLELGKDLPAVSANCQQLGQVTINLLMNACQALPSRACGIWLSTAFCPVAGEVTITVRDEGCGIAANDRARVLEPFFTTKLDSGGTGLGLSICRSIVKEHGGVLEFESEPGQGSTFVVRLPVRGEGAVVGV